MATKKRTKPAKASAVTKRAVAIYDEQKETYQKMLKTKVRQGKKVTTAAKEASEVYKKMYGATPTTRWKRALREAKSDTRDRVPIVGAGTMAPTKRRPRKR